MLIIVGILVLSVIVLAHKAGPGPGNATPTGNPNGVVVSQTAPMQQPLAADNSLPATGATGVPSPYTGVGLPGAASSYKAMLQMQGNPRGARRYNAFQSSPKPQGTGLLDPLPDRGTRSKQLLTKDVLRGPGKKL